MPFFLTQRAATLLCVFLRGQAMVMEAVVSIIDEGTLMIQMPAQAN